MHATVSLFTGRLKSYVTSILVFHLRGFHGCGGTLGFFLLLCNCIFSSDPTLSEKNRISNFKKTSFHCNVSECKITSDEQISLVSLETRIKLIISYFTSAKQYPAFSCWTLTNITGCYCELRERYCPLVPDHQSYH